MSNYMKYHQCFTWCNDQCTSLMTNANDFKIIFRKLKKDADDNPTEHLNCSSAKPSVNMYFVFVHLSPLISHFHALQDQLHSDAKVHFKQIILNKYERLSPQQPIFIYSCISIKLALAWRTWWHFIFL